MGRAVVHRGSEIGLQIFFIKTIVTKFNVTLIDSLEGRQVSPFSQATKALRESRGTALLCFQTSALEGGEGSASRPGRLLPPGKTLYPLYRRLGGPKGRSGQVRKSLPPPGFDPRTVKPVASRYTD
jgi:hypothetical protein